MINGVRIPYLRKLELSGIAESVHKSLPTIQNGIERKSVTISVYDKEQTRGAISVAYTFSQKKGFGKRTILVDASTQFEGENPQGYVLKNQTISFMTEHKGDLKDVREIENKTPDQYSEYKFVVGLYENFLSEFVKRVNSV